MVLKWGYQFHRLKIMCLVIISSNTDCDLVTFKDSVQNHLLSHVILGCDGAQVRLRGAT